MRRRTVAVLGPIPRDRVITHNGDVLEKYGCVLYTVAALAALLGPFDRICPVVHLREEDEEPVREALSGYPTVDQSGISVRRGQGDVVELSYLDQNTRIERQTGFMAPIRPEDVSWLLEADAFVCVPITDYQVSLETLRFIRTNSSATIILDAHGPTSTLTRGGERVQRLWVDRDAWLPSVDILKMNAEEAGCSWFPADGLLDNTVQGGPLARTETARFADHCLRRGVRMLCVTLDAEGCAAYTLGADGELQEHLVPRLPVDHVVDTTGCGDSFAAGLAFGWMEFGDAVAAARFGNAMGAQRCAGSELGVYLPREETSRQIESAYGAAPV